MPKKCKKQCKCHKNKCDYNPCYDPSNNYYNGNYNYYGNCYNPCCPPLCPPCPTGTTGTTGTTGPVAVTDIAVFGSVGIPIAAGTPVSFTVSNVSPITAQGVIVNITPSAAVAAPIVTSTTQGTAIPLGINGLNWNVGTLLPSASATIIFTQPGTVANTWTAIGFTTTPETNIANNTAIVFVSAIPG